MSMTSPRNPDATAELRPIRATGTSLVDAFARRVVLAKLEALRGGCLVISDGAERHRFGKPCAAFPEPIVIHVHDSRLYGDLAFGGSIGAGEAYMRGYWSTTQRIRRFKVKPAVSA